ncbi:type VI secretion system protein TssR domain-containing protein [Myroides fluvii]|uniref:type VI secretion system protein TssR domain-containing protein n=1 Tax=Myroides fluvii TaxID=2572594 RepID=UPI00131D19E6|nr:type VI secretion system protein TssR domain-containing protein [Myroides fluvii]
MFLSGLVILSGCTTKKIGVRKTPAACVVGTHQEHALLSGYSEEPKPWIVYGTKDHVALYATARSKSTDKHVAFFTPLILLKQKGNRYKVAQYEGGSIVKNKIEKKKIKEKGWVQRDDLLLWTDALRDATTGFRLKGVVALQEHSVLTTLDKYMQNDSIYLFKDPSLQVKIEGKLPLNSLVYFYGFSPDYKKIFIGESPKIEEGNPENKRFGWVDARMIGVWGERTAFRLKPSVEEQSFQLALENTDRMKTVFSPVVCEDGALDTLNLGNLYPISYRPSKDVFKVNYLDQVLDYTENKVYNIEGRAVYYDTYRNIVADNRKLNLILLVDGSKEITDHLIPLKTVFQGLNMQLATSAYFNSAAYATLFYHVYKGYTNNRYARLLDFDTWSNSLAVPLSFNKMSTQMSTQMTSLDEVFDEVSRLLKTQQNESNLIVIVGQRLTAEDQSKQEALAAKISSTGSRVIFYQVAANNGDSHNDFVLTAEEVIKRSANQITNKKKQKLVDYEGIVEANAFDLSQGDQGVYQLDFPTQSMHQGAVIFPRKGEENKPMLLQRILTKMIGDIATENQRIGRALTAVFSSDLGVSHTKIKPVYQPFFRQENTYVPIGIAKQLINQNYAFMQEGIMADSAETIDARTREYGVLLDENEMEQLEHYYRSIYANVFKKGHLNNKKMIRRYITAARRNSITPNKMNRKFWRSNPMAIGLFQQTGLYLTTWDTLAKKNLKQWKNEKRVNTNVLKRFFSQFQIIANKIKEQKENQAVTLQQNGSKFYWLNQSFIPVLDQSMAKKGSEIPLELEQFQISPVKKEENKNRTKKYIKRVKRGMP